MRKIIISSIVIGLVAIVFIVINKAVTIEEATKDKTETTKLNSDKLPLFEFFTLDAIPYSKYNLEKNQSLIIVYYDPDCSLCAKSGEVFSTFKKLHASSQVLFVSHNTKEKIEAYRAQFNLEEIPNIKFLQSNADEFYKLFNESSTPTYLIYNTKQELIKIINDDIPVKSILRYIRAAQID
jgi:peroxiredoxin